MNTLPVTRDLFGGTKVVDIRTEGCDVYIGRADPNRPELGNGYFGNPYPAATYGIRALERYDDYLWIRTQWDPEFRRRVIGLRGKVLGCWCKPGPCHGDKIVRWLDAHPRLVYSPEPLANQPAWCGRFPSEECTSTTKCVVHNFRA